MQHAQRASQRTRAGRMSQSFTAARDACRVIPCSISSNEFLARDARYFRSALVFESLGSACMPAGVPPWGLAAVVPPLPVVSGPAEPCG
jgi:hypothetical protein